MAGAGILSLVDGLFRIYGFIIIARVFISWVDTGEQMSPLVGIINRITDPVIIPCRELLNSVLGVFGVDTRTFPLDFSPILAYLILEYLVRAAVIRLLGYILG